MRIAIVNKKIEYDPDTKDTVQFFERVLKKREHYVSVGARISELSDKISTYDLVIGHPELDDCRVIGLEVRNRKNFRFLINSTNPEDYADPEIRDSDQVYSSGVILLEKTLVKLVEEGW